MCSNTQLASSCLLGEILIVVVFHLLPCRHCLANCNTTQLARLKLHVVKRFSCDAAVSNFNALQLVVITDCLIHLTSYHLTAVLNKKVEITIYNFTKIYIQQYLRL